MDTTARWTSIRSAPRRASDSCNSELAAAMTQRRTPPTVMTNGRSTSGRRGRSGEASLHPLEHVLLGRRVLLVVVLARERLVVDGVAERARLLHVLVGEDLVHDAVGEAL